MINGDINECPNCGGTMKLKEAHFSYDGSYIRNFESYVGGVCHHIYFTENTKKEIMKVPTSWKTLVLSLNSNRNRKYSAKKNKISKISTQTDNIHNAFKDENFILHS